MDFFNVWCLYKAFFFSFTSRGESSGYRSTDELNHYHYKHLQAAQPTMEAIHSLRFKLCPKSHSVSTLQCGTLIVWCTNFDTGSAVPNRTQLFFCLYVVLWLLYLHLLLRFLTANCKTDYSGSVADILSAINQRLTTMLMPGNVPP